MAETEEIRTRVVWDTADVDKGERRVLTALDRLRNAEEKASRGRSGKATSFISDLASGRGLSALGRFGVGFGAIGGAAAIAASQVQRLNQEIKQTVGALSSFGEGSRKASQTALFTTAGAGSGAIAGVIESARDRQRQGHEALRDSERELDPLYNPTFAARYRAAQALARAKGIEFNPIEQAQDTTRQDIAIAGQDEGRARGRFSQALANERDIAELQGPVSNAGTSAQSGGDRFAAEKKMLDLQQQQAEAEATKVGASKEDLDLIKQKYDILRNTVAAERTIGALKRADAQDDSVTRAGTIAGSRTQRVGLAKNRIDNIQRLIDSGTLTQEQLSTEQTNLQNAKIDLRDSHEDLFFNADGTKRTARDRNAILRSERRANRARKSFRKEMERRAGADQPGGGIGRHSDSDWANTFVRTKAAKPSSEQPQETTLDKILQVLNSRLPSATF